ncbi:hypothetical protein BU26DRAFT_273654 [Trematosphaeria pertusa]|uniref:Uncharacterized protein n=1 Tax=Trematosphaeria pertusa TaxID=390896 RepID=A0A6A6IK13_9PLEO|nr:uncharacterized protein BU26DRAFT_273654 [Trematosphaeria pertusa]KAF2250924.1 hypothetical protein BU26DRAFT_273654 [Trematosphaeria pertusa]
MCTVRRFPSPGTLLIVRRRHSTSWRRRSIQPPFQSERSSGGGAVLLRGIVASMCAVFSRQLLKNGIPTVSKSSRRKSSPACSRGQDPPPVSAPHKRPLPMGATDFDFVGLVDRLQQGEEA